ncbi:saccharopine dehydrogenase NADP-binding domain-containing protein [Oerskovia flava]|uniref:saccharopine dehydrogenase NADP-binding domain-containing protein n=1 Tax=Oerskovia flava TaxID=2986422 RepID=UPI0022406541|nr:saccharopine dehydrogenase NADP-binding domain-containing protein [Oerskovia sp. JB1-3-2]
MTTAKTDVLVVGGYGAVGSAVCEALAGTLGARVVPAGRDARRAAALADRLGLDRSARVDLDDLATLRAALDGVGVVVLCVEPGDDRVARLCVEHGAGLVDVSATRTQLEAVERLDAQARRAGSPMLLSVGVAPGLTNLLARRAHEGVGGAERIDLTVVLGAGERHGADAVRWTVDQLVDPTSRTGPRSSRRLHVPGFGDRTAHPFDFSDQHTLRRTLGVPRVATRFSLDSRVQTRLLFGARRLGLLRAMRAPRARRALVTTLGRFHAGGDRFTVMATASSARGASEHALTARGQGRFTGLVAAAAARAVLAGQVPPGVHHLEQVAALQDLPERLVADGASVVEPATRRNPAGPRVPSRP